MNLGDIRRDYSLAVLDETHVDVDPIEQFRRWLAQAIEVQALEPTAATLATASRDGAPSARIVLVKGVDAHLSLDLGPMNAQRRARSERGLLQLASAGQSHRRVGERTVERAA